MKASNYIFSIELEELNQYLMYNSFTSSLALMEKDNFLKFTDFVEDNIIIEDEELIKQLKLGGFIVEDNVDEYQELKIRLWKGRCNSSMLGLTIAPTSDCNFDCIYCYEKNVITQKYMSEEVQKALVELVRNHVNSIKYLSVTWYGGEPLLSLDIIESLSKQFISIAEEHHIEYNAGIVTNGYLLTRENVQLLNSLKVRFYQITIDGTEKTHNERRPLRSGGNTYKEIYENIVNSYDLLPQVSLRVNVDKSNTKAADELLLKLEEDGLYEKVKLYLGKVINDNDDEKMCELCFDNSEFANLDIDFIQRNAKSVNWKFKYPEIKTNYCGADCMNAYVVGPTGDLYKCWNDIGVEGRAVDNLILAGKGNKELYYDYLLYEPSDSKCIKCKILPLCMGGCPYSRIHDSKDKCSVYKVALKQYLCMITSQILEDRKIQNEKIENEYIQSS